MIAAAGVDAKHRHRAVVAALEGASLLYLTLDVTGGGLVAIHEARRSHPPGPAAPWAMAVSRGAEREAMLLTATTLMMLRRRAGAPAGPPVWRLAGGVLARAVLARCIRRPRPPRSWWRTEPHGWSFPSRHVTHAVLITGLLSEETGPTRPVRYTTAVAAVAAVVGASRVRLGVHWPSDVLGALLAGTLWLELTRPGQPGPGPVLSARPGVR